MKTHQEALLIALEMNGVWGYGEAPAIVYYGVSVQGMIDQLLLKTSILERYAFTTPDRFWHFCHHLFPNDSFLVAALDMAYWDLYAKVQKKPLFDYWNLTGGTPPLTDYTLGIDEADVLLQRMKENPWPIYKIKVGREEDMNVLRTLRKASDAIFRIDANASWSLEQTLQRMDELEALQIELIEQPLAKDAWDDMKVLREALNKRQKAIPLFADESCVGEDDVKRCAGVFDGINIKLTKCGGVTPALRMIEEARQKNLKVMMGCMNETETGTTIMAHFLPILDYADLDGPLLLQVPEMKNIRYEGARLLLN